MCPTGARNRSFMRADKPLPYVKKVRARGNLYYYFDTGRDVRGNIALAVDYLRGAHDRVA